MPRVRDTSWATTSERETIRTIRNLKNRVDELEQQVERLEKELALANSKPGIAAAVPMHALRALCEQSVARASAAGILECVGDIAAWLEELDASGKAGGA